jgi:hypothetical protein
MAQNPAEGRAAMAHKYPTTEARATFRNDLRRVRAGRRIVIAYRDGQRAECRPPKSTAAGPEKPLVRLEGKGGRGPNPTGELWLRANTRGALGILVVLALTLTPALAANTSKASDAAKEIETGAKKIGEGVKATAKGIGRTVAEGAKETGERFKEAGRAAKPPAKSAWQNVKEAASSFGRSVKNFFSRLFGKG